MSEVGKWSVVASENNKPSPDGWPENMAPSDVNNSARENMAAIKRMALHLPYVSTGGVITYVDETTFTVADDDLDTGYAKYFVEGRKINVITPTTSYKGVVVTSEYANTQTTVTVNLDEGATPLPTDLTDVMVGLQFDDVSNAVGPNMLGMVLPYTADIEEVPFGMGLANGEPFNPNIYKALADLYRTGTDDKGNPTYRYGTTTVDGNIWPNKPDVRGYFPRFLDTHANTDSDKVDPDSPRTVGSVQAEATSAKDLVLRHSTALGANKGGTNAYVGGYVYASSAERVMWRNDYNAASTVAIHSDAKETRPDNIAFPGLLVMFGGYASASQVSPEDLVESTMDLLEPRIEAIEENASDAVNGLIVRVDEALGDAEARVENVADAVAKEIENKMAGTVQGVMTASQEAKDAAVEASASAASASASEMIVKASEAVVTKAEASVKASATKVNTDANEAATSAYNAQQSALAAHSYASNAEADAENVNEAVDHALAAEQNARTWAEGDSADVQTLGGTHSSKGFSALAYAYAVAPEDVPVEEWAEGREIYIQGEKGDKGDTTYADKGVVTLKASSWNTESKTTTVSVSGVKPDSILWVTPAFSSYDNYVAASVRGIAQSTGTITFGCKTIPTVDIEVGVIIA